MASKFDSENSERKSALEQFNDKFCTLHNNVIDLADDRDGEFLGYPRAFAYAMDIIYTKAESKGIKFPDQQEVQSITSAEMDKLLQLLDECIAEHQ